MFLAFVAIMGAGQTTFVATCNSLLQLVSEPVMRGRVMAVYTIALLGTTPIGGPIIGWLAEQLGPRWAYGLGAVVTITSVLALRIAFARVHRLGGLRPRTAEFGAADEIVLGVDGEVIPASIR
jgi:MFS family permease